ncbi:MAG: sensor histidine kinase [Verrucomicrobiales bacterium]|nr:sensor histidine kinase [Verrucomicrobiales bacterium]
MSPNVSGNGITGGAWSIARRLTLLYAISTTGLLLLAAGFLFWVLKQNLEAREHALLISKVEVLRQLLQEEPDKSEVLASEVEHEASASHLLRYFMRILDGQGRLLFETGNMAKLLPVEIFPVPGASPETPDAEKRWDSASGSAFLLMSASSLAKEGQRTLQLALDVSQDQTLLANYRRTLVAVLIFGILFAAGAGFLIAQKGLAPLGAVTKATQRITASQLHERIAVSEWPAELIELASAFDAMLDRLQDSFNRLSQFSADLAHELRTPINNLRGEAEVALSRTRNLDEYQQILASSLEEHERLSRMIDGLLFIARADNPGAALDRIWFDARREVEAVREFYQALAGEQEVEICIEGAAWLRGDPALFRRAASNLLANSLQHTPAKGSINVSLRASDALPVAVDVRDTGNGIAVEHLPRIFDRFYRADRSRSQVGGGFGLGLAIVMSIMRLHGGTASIQSTQGKGTTVTLHFSEGSASPPTVEDVKNVI